MVGREQRIVPELIGGKPRAEATVSAGGRPRIDDGVERDPLLERIYSRWWWCVNRNLKGDDTTWCSTTNCSGGGGLPTNYVYEGWPALFPA